MLLQVQESIGGLVGDAGTANITNSYSGTIKGSSSVGGLVGYKGRNNNN